MVTVYGILKFSLRERICNKGVRFISFPDGEISVVNTKSTSKVDRWAKVNTTLNPSERNMELLELLGPVGNKETESKVLHIAMGIKPCRYPSYTLLPDPTRPDSPKNIHEISVFSVDNKGTKDIDDALSVHCDGNKVTVGIHITDVASTFNRLNDEDRGNLLDFAMRRASSTYTDIENTPLLPPHLTYNELSLSPGEIRKSITLWLEYENDTLIKHTFENCHVKNESAMEYSEFSEEFPTEYSILSRLSGCTDPNDIVAWSMLTYNTYFALLDTQPSGILLRHQTGCDMAAYSESHLRNVHESIGSLYTHATSPIRRYADLYNQLCWHSQPYGTHVDVDVLNSMSTNVAKFHRKHAILDLSYACRKSPQKVRIESSKDMRKDTVRVTLSHSTYTIPRYDTFYEGELIPDTDCFIWGILKNGVSTLRIAVVQGNNIVVQQNSPESVAHLSLPVTVVVDKQEEFEKEDVEDVLNHPLDAFQSQCYDVIRNGDDLFGAAPTGSGKTGVAMTAIYKAFRNNKRAIYTSPIKSLSNEKYGDFSRRLDGRVSLLTGDVKLRCTPPGGDGASELIVMTAEILRNKLCAFKSDHPDPDMTDVCVVIIDECHYINDTERGTVWEETFMNLPKHIQIVALSATLDKPERFCSWLNNRRPTKLVQRFDRHVPLFFGNIRVETSKDPVLVLMEKNGKDSKTYVWNQEQVRPSFAKLVKSLVKLELCPAIIFCMGRKRCVSSAESITDNLILPSRPFKPNESASDGEKFQFEAELLDYNNIVVDYKRKFDTLHRKYLGKFRKQLEIIPGYSDFLTLLQKGVAYHHAGMIPILREFVEVLFREKLIMAVFATETLGCGIDMPARTVVFTELEKPCGDNAKRFLRTEEFMQMSGRAGRRGRDDKGYVLYYSQQNVKIPYSTFSTIALGKPPKATSQLQITPDFVLRNYSQGLESLQNSLYNNELSDEVSYSSREYETIQHKIDPKNLLQILEIEKKLSGNFFIKFTPKQMKNAKIELKTLLGELSIDDARHQWQLYNAMVNSASIIDTTWSRCIDILSRYNFVDEYQNLTRRGIAASHMCDGMPMVRSHILDSINFIDFDVESLASWLSIFAGGTSFASFDVQELHVPRHLKKMIKHSVDLADLYYENKLNSNIAYLMFDWLTYRDISRILRFTNISSFGSFIKVVLRVSSFIEETKSILLGLEEYEKYNKLENYEERLFCGLVGNDSIYIA